MSSLVSPAPAVAAVAPGPRARPVRWIRPTLGKPIRGRDSATVPGATPSGAGEMDIVPPISREDSFEQAREAIGSVCAKRAKKAAKIMYVQDKNARDDSDEERSGGGDNGEEEEDEEEEGEEEQGEGGDGMDEEGKEAEGENVLMVPPRRRGRRK